MAGIRDIMKDECSVNEHAFFNGKSALICLQNNGLKDLKSFQSGLRKVYTVTEVVPATWVRTQN